MKAELNFSTLDSFLIGIQIADGEDENGYFSMISIGFGLFEVSIYKYHN